MHSSRLTCIADVSVLVFITVQPADWDSTPKEIPDPDAKKPEDWDDEADGEWEAPKIPNPEYKVCSPRCVINDCELIACL